MASTSDESKREHACQLLVQAITLEERLSAIQEALRLGLHLAEIEEIFDWMGQNRSEKKNSSAPPISNA
jgi:DNA-binding transcriptional MerR regulator